MVLGVRCGFVPTLSLGWTHQSSMSFAVTVMYPRMLSLEIPSIIAAHMTEQRLLESLLQL